jgi:hypothetical protein
MLREPIAITEIAGGTSMRRLITSLAFGGAALLCMQAAFVLQSEATAHAQDEQPRQSVFIKISKPN